ncbi:hypothetical protein H045_14130 [Pseudomonas poae RE*1-1-14]|uniref:hypothetical protein n=1 Tax=Pseudomonas poae TaxID=200451 RepID=UPI0002AF4DB7|nr:hypothetical protein [Pseudomonas poae]AGE26891.1 hypothetical protein H045_14130 [Pseudomonas poae RE*1-1-14]
MDIDAFFNWFEVQWALMSQAPWVFIRFSVIFFVLGYIFAKWRYGGVIDGLRSGIESLTQRVQLRAEEAEVNRADAAKWREKVSEVVNADSAALREKTLQFVERLRSFVDRYMQRGYLLKSSEWDPAIYAETDEEKQRLLSRYHHNLQLQNSEERSEYQRHFRSESQILRGELLSRLKDYKTDENMDARYDDPVTSYGYYDVASDLEKMAKSLR